ncbi:hypothetical protein NQ318_021933, partial [Aromia moschata]
MFGVQKIDGFVVEDIFKEKDSAGYMLDLFIPTTRSQSAKCRNHSLYYMSELKNYTLWATEMFDANTKFPSGILYGSSYDFGNFDECLEIRVPHDDQEFTGKYCMAKFIFNSHEANVPRTNRYNYDFEDYRKYYNISMWKMIDDYSHEPSKSVRNEIRYAYCMPSSCTAEDLQFALDEVVQNINEKISFKVRAEVDKVTCQVSEAVKLDTGDIIYIIVIVVFLLFVTMASIYNLITKRDDFAHFKLKGKLHDVTLCFSFPRNLRKLTTTGSSNSLDCLSGMKLYSMVLIILLHRDMVDYGSAMKNPNQVEKVYSMFGMTFLLNGPILVDTFFTISGFLATYLILKNSYRTNKNTNVLHLYIHRYIRMTSVYCIILAFYCTLFVKLGTGPLWHERIGLEREKCRQVWLANMLYVNNYIDTKNYCMFQSWYMACDMNGFIFVPIICWIIWKKSSAGLITVIVALGASILTIFIVVFLNNENPVLVLNNSILLFPNTDSTFLTVYIPGHMRVSSYFVGILAGYIKYKMDINDYKISKRWVYGGWALTFPLMFVALHVAFVFYVLRLPAWCSALYASLHHVLWSACIAWIIIAISSGYGPWARPILSWKPVVVLSRLTYTVYLCHGTIQLYSSGTIRNPVYASTFDLMHKLAADLILGFLLAFILTMLFESPIIGLEKILLWG